jgi:molybdopterin/thiamine biosynthesis adenylyltransferase
MTKLRILQKAWDPAWAHLNSGPGEHFVFLLARHYATCDGYVLVADEALTVSPDEVTFSDPEWVVSTGTITKAVNHALRTDRCLIEVHNHNDERPRFSSWDRAGLAEIVPYMLESLPDRPYVALVTGTDELYGEVFDKKGSSPIDPVFLLGERLRALNGREESGRPETAQFDRQLRWLTASGQQDMARLRFVIGGLGGTGSHAAVALAYLGARHFGLIDPDVVDRTSLNRLATANAENEGESKVQLAASRIQAIAPSADVRLIQAPAQDPAALEEAILADVLVGCFDNDGARLIWNELAVGYQIPLIDFGVGIQVDRGIVSDAGGRIACVIPGGPCLRCMGLIDPQEAQDALRSKTDRKVQRSLGYFTGRRAPDASVYTLNASVVNVGLTELTIWLAGLRRPEYLLCYDALGFTHARASQWLSPVTYQRNPKCVVCAMAGLGDKLMLLDRYGDLGHVA